MYLITNNLNNLIYFLSFPKLNFHIHMYVCTYMKNLQIKANAVITNATWTERDYA